MCDGLIFSAQMSPKLSPNRLSCKSFVFEGTSAQVLCFQDPVVGVEATL